MTSTPQPRLRIVYLEDDPGAFALVEALLAADAINCDLQHVETSDEYRRALAPPPDLILADFNLPSMDGLTALAIKRELCGDVPFIFVSGSLGEEVAIDSLRNGATDFVLKDSLVRLVPAIRRALAEAAEHRERLRAEQSLRESEARFRRLAENAPDVIFRFRFTPTPGYDYISAAVERLSGYRPDEFYQDPQLAGKLAHPDDRAVIRAIADRHELPRGAREIRWLHRDGREVVTEQRFVPVYDDAGRLVATEGIARDITERKKAEEQIRLLSEAIAQSPVAVELTDSSNNIVFANTRLSEMSGYSQEELTGQNPRMFASGRTPPEVIAAMWATLNEGRTWQGEFINARKDGSEYTARATITPIRGETSETKYYLAVLEDITAWKAEQDRRRQLESQLFQAQKMESIGALAGGIAHDFNNILTGILGFTEIAELSLEENHPARADLAEIRKGGLRAKDLVQQILTFSRQKDAQQVALDLARPVGEALKLVRASTPATIQLERTLGSVLVRADPTQIHQVALNLCTNAIHAMRGRHGVLRVEVATCAIESTEPCEIGVLSPGSYARLSVHDTGHGMEAATIKRIFDPFFTTKQAGEGTGLGLALVRGIVTSHGGAVRVRSTVNEGTTFDVFFPTCPEPEKTEMAVQAVALGRGERIAVVDDESSIATFAAVRLEQLHYHPTVFTDPRKALAAIVAHPGQFDALVTDLTMPHLTGTDLVRQIRAAGIRLPAVIASGNTSGAGAADVSALGNTRPLSKPFSGDELGRVLHAVLGAR